MPERAYKPKLPSGFCLVPLLFSLLRKVSSLSNFRSDSNCMSGLASISRQIETISERVSQRSSVITDQGFIRHLGDLPSRGLETGVMPLVLLPRGDATGVMAVGDARPAEPTRNYSVFAFWKFLESFLDHCQDCFWKFPGLWWMSVGPNIDVTTYRIYTHAVCTPMCTFGRYHD